MLGATRYSVPGRQRSVPRMQSRNPILNSSDTFNGRAAQSYGHETYAAGGQGYEGYGQVPTTGPAGSDPSTWTYPTGPAFEERMTIDSVVMRTALTLGLVIVTAAAVWAFLPTQYVTTSWIIGALAGA